MYFNMSSPFDFHRQPSAHYSPQNTPERPINRRVPSISPARSDPDGHAELDRYVTWLIAKYPVDKEKLLNAKDMLHDKDLDFNTIRKLPIPIFERWGIKWGLADKIKRKIKDFQDIELLQA